MVKSNSKSEDTSLDVHMAMLGKSDSAKDLGELTVVPLGFAVSIAKQLLAQQQAKLLQVIEDEVVGADDEAGQDHLLSERVGTIRNTLKAEQRQALKKLKDNVINGGSL